MKPFKYTRATSVEGAIKASGPDVAYLAGGTTMVDLLRLEVVRPTGLVDVGQLALAKIRDEAGGLSIGALASNAEVARHPSVIARFPVLSQALLSGASPQIRNMATVGGNLLQRTRCPYFRDLASPCNKRTRGEGCGAIGGYTRSHAILGTSDHCIATHPSDMAVALVALDATVHVRGPRGERAIAIADLHTLPADRPDIETTLAQGELITHVTLPATGFAARSRYVKVRDRAAFAFALASAAVALDVRDGKIADARIALGGIATKPWRARDAEQVIVGHAPSKELFARAAEAAIVKPRVDKHTEFKVELAKRTLARTLGLVGGLP